MTLTKFITELRRDVDEFEKDWILNNKASPEAFPLSFDKDNEGAWWEQFMVFRESKQHLTARRDTEDDQQTRYPRLPHEELDGMYHALNAVERGIVDAWIKGGMSRKDAVAMMYRDLGDAAEEDGYDRP